jgi:hypothetical protein
VGGEGCVVAPEPEQVLLEHGAVAIGAGLSDPPPPQLLVTSATARAPADAAKME